MQRKGDEAAKAYPSRQDPARSIEEALADKSVELVVVSTPNETHFALGQAGPGSRQARRHRQALRRHQRRGAANLARIAKKQRTDGDSLPQPPLGRRLPHGTQAPQEDAIGRLVTFESHFDRFRPIPRQNTWKEAGNPANGMLFDLGPHLVDQVLALFGAPDAITASVRADRDQTAIEDAFDITLHYPGANGKGMLAHCRTSYLACINSPRFLLHGTKGSFKKHGLDPQEPALVGGAKVPC